MPNQTGVFNRVVTDLRTELIRRNIRWLRQAHNLLQNIDDRTYAAICPEMQMQRVSRYTQVLLDLYECFLSGVGSGHIDYDSPDRQMHMSRKVTRQAAMDRISAIIFRLQACARSSEDATLWIRPLSNGRSRFLQPLLASSISRELDFLSGQAAHGSALAAIAVQLIGAARRSDSGSRAA
jgi:hypothetical protein